MAKVQSGPLIAQSNTDTSLFSRSAANLYVIVAKDEIRVAVFVCAALLSSSMSPTAAQETRAEDIRQQQVEKRETVAPQGPNPAARVIDRLEDWGFFAGAPRGPYPWFGSVYPGGGFAGGATVEHDKRRFGHVTACCLRA